jgi:hypothetical protein
VVLVVGGLTLLLALVVALDLTPWARGGYGWRWTYDPVSTERVLPLLIALGVYLLGAYLLYVPRIRRVTPVTLLLWSVAGTVVLSLATAHAREGDAFFALFTRTASGITTGQHWAAPRVDWDGGEWQQWTEVMTRLEGHISTSPPGLPMLYAALNSGLDNLPVTDMLHRSLLSYQCNNYTLLNYSPAEWASAWFGMLMPLWAGLAVFPMYGAARRVAGRTSAKVITVWWPLVPGVIAFAASWSTFYPLLSVTAFWLLLMGLEAEGRRGAPVIFLAGLVNGVALFLNFTFLPLIFLFGAYTIARYWLIERRTQQHRLKAPGLLRPIAMGVWFGLGTALPWIVFWVLGGETPIAMLQTAFDNHLDLDRPYAFWVWMHVWDWALWTGVGLAALWLIGLWRWWRSREFPPPLLSLALLATVIVLTLSGTTQGESGRIWLFLSPFVLLAGLEGLRYAAGNIEESRAKRVSVERAWLVLTAGQAAMMLVLVANLSVIGSEMTPVPPPPIATAAQPVDATFHDDDHALFRLTGWEGEAHAVPGSEQVVTLSLRWEGERRPTEAYWMGAFLVGPEGETTDPVIWQPGGEGDDRYPTTCWALGVTIGDRIDLPLPDDAEPGDWWVSLGVFGDDAEQAEGRLAVTIPGNPEDVQVGLGPVAVR